MRRARASAGEPGGGCVRARSGRVCNDLRHGRRDRALTQRADARRLRGAGAERVPERRQQSAWTDREGGLEAASFHVGPVRARRIAHEQRRCGTTSRPLRSDPRDARATQDRIGRSRASPPPRRLPCVEGLHAVRRREAHHRLNFSRKAAATSEVRFGSGRIRPWAPPTEHAHG